MAYTQKQDRYFCMHEKEGGAVQKVNPGIILRSAESYL